MDTPVQPSFIPKKPMSGSGVSASGSWLGVFLFFVASTALLASLAAAGGAFFFERYLNNSVSSKSTTLHDKETAFDPTAIQGLIRLDSRMTNARSLLQKHTASLGVFSLLAAQTLEKVQFTGFSYVLADETGIAHITLQGQADSFATVALQSDQLNATSSLLSKVVFSAITIPTTGGVTFVVDADVDPSVISYAKSVTVTNSPTPVVTASTTPAIAPTSTPTQ